MQVEEKVCCLREKWRHPYLPRIVGEPVVVAELLQEPFLVGVLGFVHQNHRISTKFVEEWRSARAVLRFLVMKRPMSVIFFYNLGSCVCIDEGLLAVEMGITRAWRERKVHVLAIGDEPCVSPQSLWSQMGALPRVEFG